MNSQAEIIDIDNIPARLRAARNGLGLSQRDFAKLGGVTLNTQHRYESGTLPPIDYLLRIGDAGSDWFWIVTGQRIGDALSHQESAFLDAIRVLDEVGRQALLICAQRMAGMAASRIDAASPPAPISAGLHDRQDDYRGE